MSAPRSDSDSAEPPAARWRDGGGLGIDYAALPHDDYLAAARRADLALARRETAACRRPVVGWNHDLIGPTEAWRDYLAATDPEWTDEPFVFVMPTGEVAA